MTQSTIVINADTKDAQAELRKLSTAFGDADQTATEATQGMDQGLNDVERSARDATRAMSASAAASADMGQRLNTAANVASAAMTGLSVAVGAVRASTELGKRSIEGYFNATEEGRAQLEQLKVQWGEMLGQLTEAVLGTDDTTEAFERLSDVIRVTTGVISGVATATVSTVNALARYTGVGLLVRTAFGGMRDAMDDATEAAERATSAVMEQLNTLSELSTSLANATPEASLQAADATILAVAQDTADLILVTQGIAEGTREWRENHDQLVDSLVAGEDQLTISRVEMDRFGHATSISGSIVDLSDALRTAGDEGERAGLALGEAGRRADEARGRLEDLARAEADRAEQAASSSSRSGGGGGAPPEATAEDLVAQALDRSNTARMEALDLIGQLMASDAQRMEYGRIAHDEEVARLASEAEAWRLKSQVAIQAIKGEEEARRASSQANEDAQRSGIEAQEGFAKASISSLSAIIAGEEGAGAAMMALIGQKLTAEGTHAIFKGGIELAFGNPQGALGIAAGLAAVAAGQAIASGQSAAGKSSTPVAAGTAPATPAQAPQQTGNTVSISNNFGLAQDPRYVASAVASALRDAQRYGMA